MRRVFDLRSLLLSFCVYKEKLELCPNSLLAHQGIKAVLAESYERIHRSNLVGMGVIPLEYLPGETADTLGLTGQERYTISIPGNLKPRMKVQVKVSRASLCQGQLKGTLSL